MQIADSTNAYGGWQINHLGNGIVTQGNPSTSSGSYLSGTPIMGQFGNSALDIFSDGTWNNSGRASGAWDNKQYLNQYAIDSTHSDRRTVYLLVGNVIRAVDLLWGQHNYPRVGTRDYTVSSLNTSMRGCASYHAARKELTILSYVSSGGSYNVITFQNVDFDTYPDPYVTLNRPEVVRVNSTVSLASNWGTNNNESYYNLKPTVTDNGKVYVTVMFTSSSLALYEFVRNGTTAVNATYVTALSITTSYGIESGGTYGQRRITSRDRTSVICFTPYYYYHCGCMAYMIDRTNNTYSTYSNTGSSVGHQPMPWKDNGWVFAHCGNGFASNYSGNLIAATYEKAPTGGFTQVGSTRYLPYHPGPNTTNYPGFTQVTDYDLLLPNNFGVK